MKKSFIIILVIVVLLAVAIPVVGAVQRNSKYTDAKAQLEAAQDLEAVYNTIHDIIAAFTDLGDFKDSKALLQEARYKQVQLYIGQSKFDLASDYIHSHGLTTTHPDVTQLLAEARMQKVDRLLAEEKHEEAINLLLSCDATSPETIRKLTDVRYAYAEQLEKEGKYEEAHNAYLQSGHTLGLKSAYSVIYSHMLTEDKIIVGSSSEVFAVAKNGTVLYGSSGSRENPVAHWCDIVAIDGDDSFLVGLKSDGTVVSQYIGYYFGYQPKYDVSEWRDIIAISKGMFILGLKADGTVIATAAFETGNSEVELSDVVSIHSGKYAITSDGTLYEIEVNNEDKFVASRITHWPKLSSFDATSGLLAGITPDGNAVLGDARYNLAYRYFYTDYYYGDRHETGTYYTSSGTEFNSSDIDHLHWSDITCIDIGKYYCIAVRKDGTVFMGVNPSYTHPSEKIATLTNVAAVASDNESAVVVLLKDGTLTGNLDSKVIEAISKWPSLAGSEK